MNNSPQQQLKNNEANFNISHDLNCLQHTTRTKHLSNTPNLPTENLRKYA